MVNPGAFQGARKAFLLGEKEAYRQAMEEGYVAEAIVNIQRRFFKRFPVDLPDNVDPSEEELAAVDDEAIEPEYEKPDPEKMSSQEYEEAMMKMEERQKKIAFKRGQIKRWMAYQYMKDHDIDTKAHGANNPYRALLCKLTGQPFGRPRTKTACNVWRKTKRVEIEEAARALAAEKGLDKSKLAALRDKVAKEMFSHLSLEERRKWSSTAEEQSLAAQAAWEHEITSPASKAPEDRQRCILGLVRFVQPILDLICEATGWKASLIAGGPEPAHGGKLNIISVHSGTTSGDVPLDFGTLEREAYKKQFVPMYGRFLKKCYSVEECHARALKAEDSLSVEAAGVGGDGVNVFAIDAANDPSQSASAIPPKSVATAPPNATTPAPSNSAPAALAKSSASQKMDELKKVVLGLVPPKKVPPRKRPLRPLPEKTRPSSQTRATTSTLQPPVAPPIPPVTQSIARATSVPPSPPRSQSPSRALSLPPSPPRSPPREQPSLAGSPSLLNEPSPRDMPPSPPRSPPRSQSPPSLPPLPARSRTPPSLPPSPPRSPLRSPPPTRPPSVPPPISRSPPPSLTVLMPPSPPRSPCPSRAASPACVRPPPPSPPHRSSAVSATPACLPPSPPPPPHRSSPGSPNVSAAQRSHLESPPKSLRRSKRGRRIDGDEEKEVEVGGPVAKKRRVSRCSSDSKDGLQCDPSSVSDQPAIGADKGAPKWFKDVYCMLQSGGMAEHAIWMDLVRRWAAFEEREGYQGTERLPAPHRPDVIGNWIQRRRSPTYRPPISIPQISQDFAKWWTAIQPEWRVSGGNIDVEKVEGDWEPLRKAGVNGLVSVMVALFYWGSAAKEDKRADGEWDLAVADCLSALTQLTRRSS